jgi:hypothetical protein
MSCIRLRITCSGSQAISSNESMGLGSCPFLCEPGGGPCRHPQIGISELRCGLVALRPSTVSATDFGENTPLFFLASIVKSADLILSLLLFGPAPLPSSPWHSAHFDRNSIRPLSGSCAQTKAFVAITMEAINKSLETACCTAYSHHWRAFFEPTGVEKDAYCRTVDRR